MAESRTQMEAQINFNQIIHNEDYAGKKITPYTWIYRWQNEQEFGINERLTVITNAKQVISFKKTEAHKYLQNIFENRPNIIIYHEAGESKLKNCSNVDHFHIISWHNAHPTSIVSYC